jgi:HSP20 family molecular chaperone IbpA
MYVEGLEGLKALEDYFLDNGLLKNSKYRNTHTNTNATIKSVENGKVITFDLVGVKKEDISINIKDNYLILKGDRKDSDGKVITKNNYRFPFPKDLDRSSCSSEYENGVLQLSFDFIEKEKDLFEIFI